MNRKFIVALALLIAVVGVIGIWMPEIREWQRERADRKEHQRWEEANAFADMWLKRQTTFFSVQRTSEETDKWYKHAKKEFCPDFNRHKFVGGSGALWEITILGDAPKAEDARCGDSAP